MKYESKLYKPAPGELLWHYTSNVGFLGIIDGREIWLSDPRFLNDSQEFRHAGLIVAHTIDEIAPRHRDAWLAKGCAPEKFDQMVANLKGRFEKISIIGGWNSPYKTGTTPFIFSLSKNKDQLSQWRAYGRGEYCIGFDAAKLIEVTKGELVEVEYRKIESDPQIAVMVNRFFVSHLVHTGGQYGSGIDTEVLMDGGEEFEGPLREANFFVRVKHDGFIEEAEVRLILDLRTWRTPRSGRHGPSDREVEIFFDRSSRYPMPRAKLRLFESSNDFSELIRDTICGPGADEQRVAQAFDMMRRIIGFAPPFSISKVPYRNH